MATLWTIKNQTAGLLRSDEINGSGDVVPRNIQGNEEFNILNTAVGPTMTRQIENGLLTIENQSTPPAPGIQVFAPRASVQAATTADISATYDATGGASGTGAFTGAPATVDSVALSDGDRILVKDQATATENGLYVATDAAAGEWSRAEDMDANVEAISGVGVQVDAGGAVNGSTQWVCISPNPIVLNTNDITFVSFSAALVPDADTIRDRLASLGGANRLGIASIKDIAATRTVMDETNTSGSLNNGVAYDFQISNWPGNGAAAFLQYLSILFYESDGATANAVTDFDFSIYRSAADRTADTNALHRVTGGVSTTDSASDERYLEKGIGLIEAASGTPDDLYCRLTVNASSASPSVSEVRLVAIEEDRVSGVPVIDAG